MRSEDEIGIYQGNPFDDLIHFASIGGNKPVFLLKGEIDANEMPKVPFSEPFDGKGFPDLPLAPLMIKSFLSGFLFRSRR